MTTKAKSDSIRKKLSNHSQKLKVPYRNVETVFLIERLVARLVADKRLSHDLSVFLPKADAETLGTALRRCFKFRETELPEKISTEIKMINTHRLKQGWANSVSTVLNAPDFEIAFDAVVKAVAKLEKSFK